MKAVSITGERSYAINSLPDPVPMDDWAVIQVQTIPICTEYKMYAKGHSLHAVGHEAAGIIEETGRTGRLAIGDRVLALPLMACGSCAYCMDGDYIYCQVRREHDGYMGTYAQYHLKPDWMCYRIPEDIPLDHGALGVCGLGPSFGGLQRLQVTAFDTVLITGMGPVGLGGVINAKYRGAQVIAVESHPYRQHLARTLGADHVLDPMADDILPHIYDLTAGQGVSKALDCSGNPQAHRLCIDAAKRLGQIAFVGECSADTVIRISPDMIRKGLTLVGSWHYNLGDIDHLMQVIRAERTRLSTFITHRFPLDRVQDAWELQMTGNCGKVLLKPWEEAT